MRLLSSLIMCSTTLLGLLLVGCAEVNKSVAYSYSPLSYVNEIEPIFAHNCIRCHGVEVARGGIYLTEYDSIIMVSDQILEKIENTGNENMYRFLNSPEDAYKIRDWIQKDNMAYE